jgi:hypothetical protein
VLTPPWLLALALVLALLALIPARRLQLAGFSARAIGGYAIVLWGFAMLIAIRPGATRVLIPMLLVAYIAPFVAGPDTVRRVLRRPAGGPGAGVTGDTPRPMKDVTPREPEDTTVDGTDDTAR